MIAGAPIWLPALVAALRAERELTKKLTEALELQRALWEMALSLIDEVEEGSIRIPFSVVHQPIKAIDAALSRGATP